MPKKKTEPLEAAAELEATAEPMEEPKASVPETSAIDESVVNETAIYEPPPDEGVPFGGVPDESVSDEPTSEEPALVESVAPSEDADAANNSQVNGTSFADGDEPPFDTDPLPSDTYANAYDDFGTQFSAAFFEEEPLRLDDAIIDENTDNAFFDNAESAEPDAGDFTPSPTEQTAMRRPRAPRELPVLTIRAHDEIERDADREAVIWHEIHSAFRTRRILTGTFGGVERLENGSSIAVVYYKNQRIVIPLNEMMITLSDTEGLKLSAIIDGQLRILGSMIGAEIDFIVRGIDSKQRSVVASRREAMIIKRRIFYINTDIDEQPHIHAGRIVQARVIAAAEQAIRIEVFGVECSIRSGDLSWDWVGDARELHGVGDRILVKMVEIIQNDDSDISIVVDLKCMTKDTGRESLKKCRVQGRYAGKVTAIRKGVVFVRLSTGVNAIAHTCVDRRTLGKKDDVSFVVTYIDEKRGTAVGIITRIIKQNL